MLQAVRNRGVNKHTRKREYIMENLKTIEIILWRILKQKRVYYGESKHKREYIMENLNTVEGILWSI